MRNASLRSYFHCRHADYQLTNHSLLFVTRQVYSQLQKQNAIECWAIREYDWLFKIFQIQLNLPLKSFLKAPFHLNIFQPQEEGKNKSNKSLSRENLQINVKPFFSAIIFFPYFLQAIPQLLPHTVLLPSSLALLTALTDAHTTHPGP